MSNRTYDGEPLDGTVQYLGEAPYWQGGDEDDVVYATPAEEPGSETTENVPVPSEGSEELPHGSESAVDRGVTSERSNQTTLDEYV